MSTIVQRGVHINIFFFFLKKKRENFFYCIMRTSDTANMRTLCVCLSVIIVTGIQKHKANCAAFFFMAFFFSIHSNYLINQTNGVITERRLYQTANNARVANTFWLLNKIRKRSWSLILFCYYYYCCEYCVRKMNQLFEKWLK